MPNPEPLNHDAPCFGPSLLAAFPAKPLRECGVTRAHRLIWPGQPISEGQCGRVPNADVPASQVAGVAPSEEPGGRTGNFHKG